MTLPAGGKARAHTIAVGSPSPSTTSGDTPALSSDRPVSAAPAAINSTTTAAAGVGQRAPGSDYFLVGEPSHDVTDGGTPALPATTVESTPVNQLGQRVHSIHLGRPMTEQETAAMQSYDFVPPANTAARRASQQSVRQSTRSSESPDIVLSPPDARYVDLPSAQSPAVNMPGPGSSAVRNPYQYPPPPRPLNPTRSAPETMAIPPPEEPSNAYSFPPAPRPASLPSSEKHGVVHPSPYATLGPDDLKSASSPPMIDRSSKPRNSAGNADPGAPPVDRGSKPLQHQASTLSNFELDGTEFEQIPMPTAGSKRFSKYGYSDIPTTPVSPVTANLIAQYGMHAVPAVSSHFSQEDVGKPAPGSYDIPPNLRLPGVSAAPGQIVHLIPADPAAVMNGQIMVGQMPAYPAQMYDFDKLQDQPNQHYSIPPSANQHYDIPPNPNQHYDIPPNPNQHYDIPPNPNQHYDIPPNPSQHYAYPPSSSRYPSMMAPPSQQYDYPPPMQRSASQRVSSSSAGPARDPSPPAENYSIPPQPRKMIPTENYSFPPPPVKAVVQAGDNLPPPDSAYSIPPPPVPMVNAVLPARPNKPVQLSGKPLPPQFNPAEYGATDAGLAGDQEYVQMKQDGDATMDDQYIDMSQQNPFDSSNGVSHSVPLLTLDDVRPTLWYTLQCSLHPGKFSSLILLCA